MKKIYLLMLVAFAAITTSLNAQEGCVPGQLLIQLNEGESLDKLTSDLADLNGFNTQLRKLDVLSKSVRIYQMTYDSAINHDEMRRAVEDHPAVIVAQFNHYVTLRETIPNDPLFAEQWQHLNIQATDAWDITTGGQTAVGDDIVVCIIEGGNLEHTDLQENAWVNELEIPGNGIDDDENGYIDDYLGWNVNSEDDNGVLQGGHGTSVMGMIGAQGDNDLGVVGVNHNVKMMSVAGENIFDEASVIEAYDYPMQMRILYEETGGAKGAFVVSTNASWGIDNGDPNDVPIWCAFYDELGANGILNCGATTNNNANIDEVGDIPTACASPYMVSVTATNINDVRTFSGYGIENVDIGAPGDNIYTTQGTSGYGNTSGTSFASPYTAGAIALLYSVPCASLAQLAHADPQAAADIILNALYEGVDPTDQLAAECASGGRLNVFNSAQLILGSCAEGSCLNPFSTSLETEDNVSFDISWASFSENDTYDFRYRIVGEEEWLDIVGLANSTVSLEELEWCSEYEYQIKTTCGKDDETTWTNSFTIITDGCCVAPTPEELVAESNNDSSIDISWESILAAESFSVAYTPADGGAEQLVGGITETSVTLSDLLPCTLYDIVVTTECALGENEEITLQVQTKGCGACLDEEYCVPSFEITEDEFVAFVGIGEFSNASGDDDGYGDFTGDNWDINVNGSYEITLAPGYGGQVYDEVFRVWMDFDHNGEFEDDEIVLTEFGVTEEITVPIEFPEDLTLGLTRMRVHIAWQNEAGEDGQLPCNDMDYGEIEDYCITLFQGEGVGELTATQLNVYPNPATDRVELTWNGDNNALFMIFDNQGKLVAQHQLENGLNVITISALAEGLYHYNVEGANGALKAGKLIKQ